MGKPTYKKIKLLKKSSVINFEEKLISKLKSDALKYYGVEGDEDLVDFVNDATPRIVQMYKKMSKVKDTFNADKVFNQLLDQLDVMRFSKKDKKIDSWLK